MIGPPKPGVEHSGSMALSASPVRGVAFRVSRVSKSPSRIFEILRICLINAAGIIDPDTRGLCARNREAHRHAMVIVGID